MNQKSKRRTKTHIDDNKGKRAQYLRRRAKGLSADFEAAEEELVDLLALVGAPHERFAAKREGEVCARARTEDSRRENARQSEKRLKMQPQS